jgi:hypothetical protein
VVHDRQLVRASNIEFFGSRVPALRAASNTCPRYLFNSLAISRLALNRTHTFGTLRAFLQMVAHKIAVSDDDCQSVNQIVYEKGWDSCLN